MKVDNRQLLQVAVAVAILAVLIVFISSSAKAIKRLFGFDDGRPQYQDTPLIVDVPIPVGYDPTPMVVRLMEVHRWLLDASPRCRAYKALMDLGDNEFILVCNEYYRNGGRTLRSDMEATFQSGCSIFSTNWQDRVLKKMDDLGVIA